jgi:conjugative transfer region protein TrbK
MSRTAKLAAACAFGGLLLAVAIVSAMRPPPGPVIDANVIEADIPLPVSSSEIRRCRMITDPDPDCDALWEAQRRRFFHGED